MSEAGGTSAKKKMTRRELLGGMGKLAYAAPVLTLLAMVPGQANAGNFPSIPCPPNEPNPNCLIPPGG